VLVCNYIARKADGPGEDGPTNGLTGAGLLNPALPHTATNS
jgi:hypothetical protein